MRQDDDTNITPRFINTVWYGHLISPYPITRSLSVVRCSAMRYDQQISCHCCGVVWHGMVSSSRLNLRLVWCGGRLISCHQCGMVRCGMVVSSHLIKAVRCGRLVSSSSPCGVIVLAHRISVVASLSRLISVVWSSHLLSCHTAVVW